MGYLILRPEGLVFLFIYKTIEGSWLSLSALPSTTNHETSLSFANGRFFWVNRRSCSNLLKRRSRAREVSVVNEEPKSGEVESHCRQKVDVTKGLRCNGSYLPSYTQHGIIYYHIISYHKWITVKYHHIPPYAIICQCTIPECTTQIVPECTYHVCIGA